MDEWMTTEDVAQYLKVSSRTVKRWQRAHRIPSYKVGSLRRYRLSEIVRWIHEQNFEQSAI